ncbi:unnamed protein product [Adineta ricciae]|uniref:Uncharacterized protein n=1 Tax=Adineta ricciae TaxID=249248 RepID=A0A814X481_ADIRI|nr:unnamed protein product [Adineta ricciae]
MSSSVSPDIEIKAVLPSTQRKTFVKLIKKQALPSQIVVIILCSIVIGTIVAVNLVAFVFLNHEQSSTKTTTMVVYDYGNGTFQSPVEIYATAYLAFVIRKRF